MWSTTSLFYLLQGQKKADVVDCVTILLVKAQVRPCPENIKIFLAFRGTTVREVPRVRICMVASKDFVA